MLICSRTLLKYLICSFGLFISPLSFANVCLEAEVELQILGSGGPEIDDNRISTSYLIWHKNKAAVLIDAGPGASIAFGNSGAKFEDLKLVLLTHLHVDHSADIPALIKGSFFTSRNHNLNIFGPSENALMPATTTFIKRLLGSEGVFAYLNDYLLPSKDEDYQILPKDVPLTKNQIHSYQIDNFKVQAIAVHHGPVAAVAWRVNIGECSIVFSGDMSNKYNSLVKLAEGADILVAHNAIPENTQGAGRNLHMPASEIGKIAQIAKVEHLVLSHFMNRTSSIQSRTLELIQKQYKGPITLATDGLVVK